MASTSIQRPRDKDLILPDEYLTIAALDDLWDWFSVAMKENLDPQLIFVKMTNTVRKPYREQLSILKQVPLFDGRLPRRDSTCYTPSEATIIDEPPEVLLPYSENGNIAGSCETREPADASKVLSLQNELAQRRNTILDLRRQNEEIKNSAQSTISTLQTTAADLTAIGKQLSLYSPVFVALKSTAWGGAWGDRYVQLNHSSATSSEQPCCAGTNIGSLATFQLVRHGDNIVSFKSSALSTYLRAEGDGVKAGVCTTGGGGVIKGGHECGNHEKFRLRMTGNHAKIAIESVEFPGRYLRLEGGWSKTVNLQGAQGNNETFYLVLLG